MKMPFFASFIIFIILLVFQITKSRRRQEKEDVSFWNREVAANQTRRKSLDNLSYISIPFSDLPLAVLSSDEKIAECIETLHSLSDSPIVNFTGYSNTDLKLEYGAPNIDLLTRYDQSYTILVRTLQRWATLLYEAGYVAEAKNILEFSISTKTDVSATYRLLAEIYKNEGHLDQINEMIDIANSLRSASKNVIVRTLKEFCQ